MLKNCIWPRFAVGLIFVSAISSLNLVAQQEKSVANKSQVVVDVTSEGSVQVGGKAIVYQSVAGTLTVGSNDVLDASLGTDESSSPGPDQATARVFYVAYFKKNAEADRPITFIYNGGPGASTMTLHLGAFGPHRAVVPDATPDRGAPYKLVNNDYSLLDASDLVFIDAPGTGYGRITGPGKLFWSSDQDTHAFSRFIRRFLTHYDRWSSPKYLLGESYGTLRNAMVSADLSDVHFNGIVMISQILNFDDYNGGTYNPGTEQAYALALPTYAATAFYYHRLPSQPAALEPFLAEVEQFALGDYMSALLQGSELGNARKEAIAEKLHSYTGLPVALWLKADLRVPSSVFEGSLLADSMTTTSQLDARYSGASLNPLSSSSDYDPLINTIVPALMAAFYPYARHDLHYVGDQTYHDLLGESDHFSWDWQHKISEQITAQGPATGTNVMPDLAYAMKLNPKMKVLLTGGYYDQATPFFEAIYEMHHLPIPQELQANISYHFYPSGHMVYLHTEVLKQLHADVSSFINASKDGSD